MRSACFTAAAVWLLSCAQPGPASRLFNADLCDLTSDRTVVSIQEVEIISTGNQQNLRFDTFLPSGEQSTSFLQSTPIRVRVRRVLRGEALTDFFLGQSVSLNGSSDYGDVSPSTTGIFFIRRTGGHLLALTDGFFVPHGEDRVRNQYEYVGGIPTAELEAAIVETTPGTPCPHDAQVPRYDTSGSP